MEQNLCSSITHVQLVRSCAVFGQLKGLVEESNENVIDDPERRKTFPQLVDSSDLEQFPALGSRFSDVLPQSRQSQSIDEALEMNMKEHSQMLGGTESVDLYAENSNPETWESADNTPTSVVFNATGSWGVDHDASLKDESLGLLPDISAERRELMQRLTTMILGDGSKLKAKHDAVGSLYPREVLDPLSYSFNTELCRNGQGLYECPFADCQYVILCPVISNLVLITIG